MPVTMGLSLPTRFQGGLRCVKFSSRAGMSGPRDNPDPCRPRAGYVGSRAGSRAFLRVWGWQLQGCLPEQAAKAVLIAAPHTTNWDLPYTLRVDRSKANNLVAAAASALKATRGPAQLMVPPEGTRGRTRHWKTGFYFIALEARVPIVLAFMDNRRKVSGLRPMFVPTGNVEADMAEIKRFYARVQGRNAAQFEAA